MIKSIRYQVRILLTNIHFLIPTLKVVTRNYNQSNTCLNIIYNMRFYIPLVIHIIK